MIFFIIADLHLFFKNFLFLLTDEQQNFASNKFATSQGGNFHD